MPATRRLTIVAQDPSIKAADGSILTTSVDVPDEVLGPGPRGHRVHVVDYDSSQQVLYREPAYEAGMDPYEGASDSCLLEDPKFHSQNVYGIVMRLLSRFEAALGRRVSWSFEGHQLHIVPHAFADANAYYSADNYGLFFGYFPGLGGNPVYTCLSHDVVAHEATHALIDGLRDTYTLPSHADQAGFHEGFSDVIALLSVFGLRDVVKALLPESEPGSERVFKDDLLSRRLKQSVLMGLAEQFGQEASRYRKDSLRRAVERPPEDGALDDPGFEECHIRGEILSAAVLNTFIEVWRTRLEDWLPDLDETVPMDRVVEDGSDAAEHMLTMCIRALDYCPAVDITFPDFLSALLTADRELLPDDGKYKYRRKLLKQFKKWGIEPASGTKAEAEANVVPEVGLWVRQDPKDPLQYDCVHRESLESTKDEVFRFLWENREKLRVYDGAYAWVVSVRPCIRVAPDGFVLKETVATYRSALALQAGQLATVHEDMAKPEGMPDDTEVRLRGGGVLLFDEFGRLKYHVRSRIDDAERQSARLAYLWRNRIHDRAGRYGFSDGAPRGQRFAMIHARRDGMAQGPGEWDE